MPASKTRHFYFEKKAPKTTQENVPASKTQHSYFEKSTKNNTRKHMLSIAAFINVTKFPRPATSNNRTGQDERERTEQDRTGQDRTRQDRTATQDRTKVVTNCEKTDQEQLQPACSSFPTTCSETAVNPQSGTVTPDIQQNHSPGDSTKQ